MDKTVVVTDNVSHVGDSNLDMNKLYTVLHKIGTHLYTDIFSNCWSIFMKIILLHSVVNVLLRAT